MAEKAMVVELGRERTKGQLLQTSSEQAAEKVLDEAVRRTERWMSMGRIFFSLISFATNSRASWLWECGRPSPRGWLILSTGICFIAFSLELIRRTSRGPLSRWTLAISVTVDAIMCATALLANALWPSPHYLGNFRSMEIMALLLTIIISGFRLSPRVVWLSIGLNTSSAMMLRWVDAHLLGLPMNFPFWFKLTIYLSSAAILAMMVALHTRKLVIAGANDSQRAHRAQHALGALLQDHHDVRSLISSANLNAERLRRDLGAHQLQKVSLEFLRDDLRAVSTMISTLRERTLQELLSVGGSLQTELAQTVRKVTPSISRRFPQVRIEVDVPDDLQVRMAGGATVLERVLLNVLLNACQGDGTRAAREIWVNARRVGQHIHLRVEDNGPGFHDSVTQAALDHIATSKLDGSGLGLFLVQVVVSASEGQLILTHRPGGGARVEIVLPAAAI